jgi:transcriptional regulator with XRE-family HTH domain
MTTNDNTTKAVFQHKQYRASGLNAVMARNVVRLREERGHTQVGLANRSGLSRLMVVGIENGSRLVGVNDLPGLCVALECSLDDLMHGDDDEPIDDFLSLGHVRRKLLRGAQTASLDELLRRIIREEVRRAL